MTDSRPTELSRAIKARQRERIHARHARHHQQPPALHIIGLPKHPNCFSHHPHRAPEIDLKQRARLRVVARLDLRAKRRACVVVHDVHAAERRHGACECSGDFGRLGNVEWEDEELGGRVLSLQGRELGGVAEGRDGDVALREDVLCYGEADAGRRTGN